MALVATVVAFIALGWAAVASTLGLIAVVKRQLQIRRLPAVSPAKLSPIKVLLIRPCAGDEPTLARCLLSILKSHYSFQLDVVMAVSRAQDGAVQTIKDCCQQIKSQGLSAEFQVHPPRGPNRKAAILAGICEQRAERYDVVVNADSNSDLTGYQLDQLIAPIVEDRAAVVWAPPSEEAEQMNLGNRASIAVLTGSLHAFGLLSGLDPTGLVGKLFAVATPALKRVGGFYPLTDYLGEDAELARRLLAQGDTVLPAAQPVRAISNHGGFAGPVARHARWMAVIRAQRAGLLLTYPLFFFSTLLIPLLVILGAWSQPLVAGVALAVALTGRLFISIAARSYSRRQSGPLVAVVDVLLADVVLLLAFIRALGTTRINWRGNQMRITKGGKLVAEQEEARE